MKLPASPENCLRYRGAKHGGVENGRGSTNGHWRRLLRQRPTSRVVIDLCTVAVVVLLNLIYCVTRSSRECLSVCQCFSPCVSASLLRISRPSPTSCDYVGASPLENKLPSIEDRGQTDRVTVLAHPNPNHNSWPGLSVLGELWW